MKKTLLCLLLSLILVLVANAQIPFEKNGKWGLLDNSNNKVLVKPQFLSISPVHFNNSFIVSKLSKNLSQEEQQFYGVINSDGKILIPIKADSITFTDNRYLVHRTKYEQVNETRLKPYQFTELYDLDGKVIKGLYGYIESSYPAGFVFMAWEDKDDAPSWRKNQVRYLLDEEFNKIYDTPIKVWETGKAFIIIGLGSEKHILRTNTFEDIGAFSGYYDDYRKITSSVLLIQNHGTYGYVNLESGDIVLPQYNCSYHSNRISDTKDCILYSTKTKEALSIDKNGNIINGKIIGDNNYTGNYIFVPLGSNGSFSLEEFDCEDAQPVIDNRGKYSVFKDNKWGLYDLDAKELVIPCVLPSPISKILRNNYVVLNNNNSSSLYDNSGNLIISSSNGEIVDVENGLVYIDNSWAPKAIYSINTNSWIVPNGKYLSVCRLSGENFAVETATNTYNIISNRGKILNTISNVSNFNNWHDEFINVVTTSGKLGLMNKTTAQWIAQPVYENDIAWGSGEGSNRRIALSKKTNNGEQVVVMTVSGKIIASQNFPYGTKQGVIRNFGRKYLYQSF